MHGACILYPSVVYDASAIVDTLATPDEGEHCSALLGVPTHFLGVLKELERRGITLKDRGLRTGIASGSPVPMELMRRLQDAMGLEDLTIAYGMSERECLRGFIG
jgi:acyl-CoA synthetase (AMP-forming)/AMP-acid ligase II